MKRKNSKKSRISDNSFTAKDVDYDDLRRLYNELKIHMDVFERSPYSIPISIFNSKLSPLEAIAKYLHENYNLNFQKISKILNRSDKTIWQAYSSAKKKLPKKFSIRSPKFFFPSSLFSDRKLSILEHLVTQLKKSHNLSFSDIAKLLGKDQRTIWTVFNRAKKKHGR